MAESEAMQSIVNQTAIQAATTVMMLRNADVGPRPVTNTVSQRESQRQRHGPRKAFI